MKRLVIDRPGGYERLHLVEEPERAPQAGEIAIDVEAIGVNYADGIIRMGLYESAKRLHGYPLTPGFEVAGRVAAPSTSSRRARLRACPSRARDSRRDCAVRGTGADRC